MEDSELVKKEVLKTINKFKLSGFKEISLLTSDAEELMSYKFSALGKKFANRYYRMYTKKYLNLMKTKYGQKAQDISVKRYQLAKKYLDSYYSEFKNLNTK